MKLMTRSIIRVGFVTGTHKDSLTSLGHNVVFLSVCFRAKRERVTGLIKKAKIPVHKMHRFSPIMIGLLMLSSVPWRLNACEANCTRRNRSWDIANVLFQARHTEARPTAVGPKPLLLTLSQESSPPCATMRPSSRFASKATTTAICVACGELDSTARSCTAKNGSSSKALQGFCRSSCSSFAAKLVKF